MKIICPGLTWWFWFSCVHLATTLAKVEYLYCSEGETVIFRCMPGAFRVSWNGPAHMNLNTIETTETDIYGKKRNWNISAYFNQIKFDHNLPHLNRLEIVGNQDAGEYDLKIRNVSLFDEGLYECDFQDINNTIASPRYLLQIEALPTEMEFVNATWDNTISGIENEPLTIECRVKSGKPAENLTLKSNEMTKSTERHGSIVYTFIPDRKHHNTHFVCEAHSPLTPVPLTKTVAIEIKYKPIFSTTNKEIKVNEGTNVSLCSSVDSNPAPFVIWWSKGRTKLINKNSITSPCYTIPNITRKENGNYTCSAENEIGQGSVSTTVLVKYPPVVQIEYSNVTLDEQQRNMLCIAEGIPKDYTYSQWEHRSEYNEHIRFLHSTSTGNLILPSTELKYNRYQDSGIYICRVSNGIPDRKGTYEQEGKVYFVSKGPPVFVKENSPTQYGQIGQTPVLKFNVLSHSEITCIKIRTLNGNLEPNNTLKIVNVSIRLTDVFHGQNVSVNGLEIKYTLKQLRKDHFQLYNMTVCNVFGSRSYIVELVSSNIVETNRTENDEKWTVPISFFCVVLLFAIILLIVYKVKIKKRTGNRMMSAMSSDRPARTDIETAHYIEINEDINFMATSRDNNATDASVANRDIARDSMEHISESSDYDSNPSEYLDDGYEKPYTTLMETNRVHDEHVYLITNMKSGNEKSMTFDNAGCEQALKCTEQTPSLDKTKSNDYVNYAQNNIHVRLKTVDNNLYEVEYDIQAKVYPDKNKAQYVNLSLKQ